MAASTDLSNPNRQDWTIGRVTPMENTACPDHTSHEENVAEAMGYRPGEAIRHEDADEWQARVDAEYRVCEGH